MKALVYMGDVPKRGFFTLVFNQRNQTYQNTSKYIAKTTRVYCPILPNFKINPPKIP